jgi:hypothetical protein
MVVESRVVAAVVNGPPARDVHGINSEPVPILRDATFVPSARTSRFPRAGSFFPRAPGWRGVPRKAPGPVVLIREDPIFIALQGEGHGSLPAVIVSIPARVVHLVHVEDAVGVLVLQRPPGRGQSRIQDCGSPRLLPGMELSPASQGTGVQCISRIPARDGSGIDRRERLRPTSSFSLSVLDGRIPISRKPGSCWTVPHFLRRTCRAGRL